MDSLSAAPFHKTFVLYMLIPGPLKGPLKINYTAIRVHDLVKNMCLIIVVPRWLHGLRIKYLTFHTLVKFLVL